jgi:hypothetical protein
MQHLFEKKRRRRESHNLVERRRRDNINDRIQVKNTYKFFFLFLSLAANRQPIKHIHHVFGILTWIPYAFYRSLDLYYQITMFPKVTRDLYLRTRSNTSGYCSMTWHNTKVVSMSSRPLSKLIGHDLAKLALEVEIQEIIHILCPINQCPCLLLIH